MSDTGWSSQAGAAGPADIARDFELAERAFQVVRSRRPGDGTPDSFTFSAHLKFLLTIGYLTNPQAAALFDWFEAKGMTKLPALAGPVGGPSPTMYEILATKIHFGTPEEVRRMIEAGANGATGDPLAENVAAGVLAFFAGLAAGVADAITDVLGGVTEVLQAGTELVHAATELVHEIHDLVLLAA